MEGQNILVPTELPDQKVYHHTFDSWQRHLLLPNRKMWNLSRALTMGSLKRVQKKSYTTQQEVGGAMKIPAI